MDKADDDLTVKAKELDAKDRNAISNSQFAWPAGRKLPIHDAAHVRNALARFNQTQGMTPAEKKTAWAKIKRAAQKFGIDVKAEMEPDDDDADEATEVDDEGVRIHAATAWLMAGSIDLPHVDGHPNRMPFSGILTRIGVPSDRPPHGALGKRVLLTMAAAEAALDSLLGMGVDLTNDFNGHDVQKKIGVITSAHIDGDALHIAGFIYSSDFPREALRIHLDQADLGFSFEAQNLRVAALDADPLVINSCVFTGAAILLKNQAAYETTALAAARAKEYEMDEIREAVQAALTAALEPVTKTLSEVAAAQTAQAEQIAGLQRSPGPMLAAVATVNQVEPHAARLEAASDGMEKSGIGLHDPSGHVHHLRRMAQAMRAEAARGMVPHSYHDGASSYFAMAANAQPLPPVAHAPAPKIEDSAEFKLMRAAFDHQLQRAKEDGDVMKTQMADMQAKLAGLQPSPQRKTITPEIQQLLARAGLSAPDGDDQMIPIGKIDAALAGGNLSTTQRMHLKTALARAGVITNGLSVQ